MAGLIQGSMTAPPKQGQMPPGADPEEQGEPSDMAEGQEPNEPQEESAEASKANQDPNYAGALKFAMQALYKNGGAEGVAESLRSAKDPAEALANTAYEIMSVIEERTQGSVPDEYFGLLATRVLQEVSDIAEAAHVDMKPSDIALALKQMILRYLGEQGYNTSQLQQQMDKVNPEMFNQMAQEGGMQ